jgi:hypothetical protein
MLARTPDRKRATEYLLASAASPITVVSRGDAASIITAMTTSGTTKGRCWLHAAQDAASVAAQARRFAGVSPDHRGRAALSGLDATLTPDDVARDHFRIFAKT